MGSAISSLRIARIRGTGSAAGAAVLRCGRLPALIWGQQEIARTAHSASDRAARTSINLNARFAPLDKLIFSVFDRPKPNEEDPE